MNEVHYSRKSIDWATPKYLFDKLDNFYDFNLDVCATEENAKCLDYFTPQDNGLIKTWEIIEKTSYDCSKTVCQGRVWCNPPYGREIKHWVKKAYDSVQAEEALFVVMLLPARTDTAWWHDYVMKGQITFLRGRLKFGDSKNSAPFPSAIIVLTKIFR